MHAFPVDRLPRPLAVVCHDAGGANIIAAGLEGVADRVQLLAEGPARSIFRARFPDMPVAHNLEEALRGARALLSGTGWATDLEFRARRLAGDKGILAVAVIDHWVNYRNRFIRESIEVLPDRFWVTDEEARDEAHRHFDPSKVDLVSNPYLDAQLAAIAPIDGSTGNVLLYVLEPIRADWGRDRTGEFQALDYLVEMLPRLGLPADVEIRLRRHPSEPADKYRGWIAAQPDLTVTEDRSATMGEAIGAARWVAGCESFGLVMALRAGRPVICTLPPWAPACRLPHRGFVHMKSLTAPIECDGRPPRRSHT